MAELFFKKLNELIAQCSLISLMSLVFVAGVVDLFTAYLNFWLRPELFLRHELNPWLKAAFYYGEWEKLFIPWVMLIGLILFYAVVLKYSKKGIFLNFGLIFLITLLIGAALTNLCGIIFNSPEPGSFLFFLIEILSVVFLILGAIEQISAAS